MKLGKRQRTEALAVLLHDALLSADISRLMGNIDWRAVFNRVAANVRDPIEKQTLLSLAEHCSEVVLDVAWRRYDRTN